MRTSIVHAVLAVAVGGIACTSSTSGVQTAYNATLNNMYVVPTDSSLDAASLSLTVSGLTVNWTLTITSAPTALTTGHIHVGSSGANGAILLNLCGTGQVGAQAPTPACTGTVTGSYTSASSTSGMPGLATESFATFVTQIENLGDYAQLHSATHPAGEIRGQILRVNQGS